MADKRNNLRIHPLLVITCWLLLASICNAEPVLSASTEVPTKGESLASPSVVKVILAVEDKESVLLLDECVQELGLKENEYHKLFRSVKVRIWQDGKELFFVRPAIEPYCMAFYGAHLFRYWLVTVQIEAGKQKTRVLYAGGGDTFDILPVETLGYNDIVATGCTARGCSTAEVKFDGSKYVAFKCIMKTFSSESDDMEEKIVNCHESD